ncbi:HAD family hydrolase (plasmid) [Rhizobium sp. CB3060]|uniref:D-glycero-alpha-D-manno-heptose-1,7-bisphosphate 7-phosphatase n=1 Tax=Rhizobium sp. CB3060 TaxID=3138255 RepID=UPI0021A550BE|nr:HAD family hydrolase [Rhizobium tropici]UWU23561.1 HAD family hydrolase [Rhizobium tropici]
MAKAVFLDRDGVINRAIVRDGKPYPPASVQETEILPDVAEALTRLKDHGYLLIVVTNQPDVARGTTSRETVEAINGYLSASLPIDEFRTCYHDSGDSCDCRKPRPGSLLAAAALHDIDMTHSFMVGDRWRDVEAGQNAGCKTIFIDYGYSEKQPEAANCRASSLGEAVDYILEEME